MYPAAIGLTTGGSNELFFESQFELDYVAEGFNFETAISEWLRLLNGLALRNRC